MRRGSPGKRTWRRQMWMHRRTLTCILSLFRGLGTHLLLRWLGLSGRLHISSFVRFHQSFKWLGSKLTPLLPFACPPLVISSATVSAGYKAGLDSALAASVDRAEVGTVLSAVQMIQSLSELLSPLLIGQIMAWCVSEHQRAADMFKL